ncbi:MAG: extracellular solute-binding protein [Ktedonobacterales bacterium]
MSAILFVFLMPLAACGGSSSASSGPVTITYWYTEGTGEQDAIKTLVSQFHQQNPNITVNAQYIDFNSAHDKFVQAARAGTAPDVLRSDVGWNTEFAADHFLYDITSLQGSTSDYLKAPLAYCTWQGKLYGLPQVTDFLVLYYNKSMLSAKHVTAPKTMQDFDAANKALTGGGKYGWEFQTGSYFAQAFIFAFGGGLIDDSTTPAKPIINSPNSISGLNFLKQELAYSPKIDFTNGYGNMMTDFKTGKVAMIINGPWEYNNILSGDSFKDPSNLGIAALPYDSATGDVTRSPAGGQNYVMYAGTKHADAAFKFTSFMSSKSSQITISSQNKTIATRQSALSDSQLAGNAAVASFASLLPTQKARPVTPLGGNIYAAASGFDPNLQKFLTGQEDAAAAAAAISTGFQAQLATVSNG